jgi:competence protein ComEC
MNFSNTPLLQALLALCAGILLADTAGLRNLTILTVAGIAWCMLSLFLWVRGRARKAAEYLFCLWVIAGCVLLGFILMHAPCNSVPLPPDTEMYVEGVIRDAVDWQKSTFSFDGSTNSYATVDLDIYRASVSKQPVISVDERIRCTLVSIKPVPLQRGDHIGVHGHWRKIKPAANPGEFDAAAYYRARGITYRLTASRGIMKWRSPVHVSPVLRLRRYLDEARCRCARVFTVSGSLHTEAVLMKRMLLGIRESLPEYISEVFTRTSTFHIIAISGLHIGIIWSLWWMIAWLAGVPGRYRGICLLPFLWLYGCMVGFRPSVVRAMLMFTGLAAAPLCRRPNSVLNTLIAAAFIYVLRYPRQLPAFGTLLTFLSVVSLIAGAPLLDTVLAYFSWYRGPAVYDLEHRSSSFLHTGIRYTLHIMCGTVAIWVVTWPITLTRNNLVTPASWLANLLLIPATGIVLAGGFATVLLSAVWPAAAAIVNICTLMLLKSLMLFIAAVSRIPGGYFSMRTLTAPALFWYYCALGITYIWSCRILVSCPGKRGGIRLLGVAALAVWLIAGWHIAEGFSRENILRIVSLDVGLGDATVIHTPGGRTILVDGGVSYGPWSMGSRVVVPCLRAAGVNSLDAVICSHFDKDHVGGLADVVNLMKVDSIYSPCQLEYDLFAFELKSQAESKGIAWHEWYAGTTHQWDSVTCAAVHPPGIITNWLSDAVRWGDNTWSLVIQGECRGMRFLLTGDATEASEAIQRNTVNDLYSHLLKVGHHGSATSSSEPYISAVSPVAASIGVGPNNFGLPTETVLNCLKENTVTVMRTDVHGAIEYRFESDAIVISTYKSMETKTECTK